MKEGGGMDGGGGVWGGVRGVGGEGVVKLISRILRKNYPQEAQPY